MEWNAYLVGNSVRNRDDSAFHFLGDIVAADDPLETPPRAEAARSPQPGNRAGSFSQQDDVRAMPQGRRRSARVAPRRGASRIGLEPGISQPRTRSRSGAAPTQAPRSHSPIEDTKAHTTARRSRGESQGGAAKLNQRSQRRRQRRSG